MKRFLLLILLIVSGVRVICAQYPGANMVVKTMEGRSRQLSDFISTEDGHATLFIFWETCCPTNLNMIDCIFDLTDESGRSDKITVVLVSVDDVRSSHRVVPVVKTKGWKADVILDVNMDLARAMSVYIPPQWVAVDNTGKPIFRRKIMDGESDAEYYFKELVDELNSK